MNHYFESKYPISRKIRELEKFENELRKKLHTFEMHPLKTKSKTVRFYNEVITPSKVHITSIGKDIKGFNKEMFLIGTILFHTATIYKKRILLNEMGVKAFSHMMKCLALGIGFGYLFGEYMGSSLSLYRTYRGVYKRIHLVDFKFQEYYLTKHEEIFDE